MSGITVEAELQHSRALSPCRAAAFGKKLECTTIQNTLHKFTRTNFFHFNREKWDSIKCSNLMLAVQPILPFL